MIAYSSGGNDCTPEYIVHQHLRHQVEATRGTKMAASTAANITKPGGVLGGGPETTSAHKVNRHSPSEIHDVTSARDRALPTTHGHSWPRITPRITTHHHP